MSRTVGREIYRAYHCKWCRNIFYTREVIDPTVSGLEFLRQSAEKCGGERLKDIDELRNKVIELVNSFCR